MSDKEKLTFLVHFLARMWGSRHSDTLLIGLIILFTSMETIWKFLSKLKMHLPFEAPIPFLGIYATDIPLYVQKRLYLQRYVIEQCL